MQPKWIWNSTDAQNDSYVDFKATFQSIGDTQIQISADSNYTLFLNGYFVSSGQYPDFPYYKIYDTIDLTPYLINGENTLKITVWYYGVSNMSYYVGNAGLWYRVVSANKTVAVSNKNTLSRVNPFYIPGRCKNITSQLGFGFNCNLDASDNAPYFPSVETNAQPTLFVRPVKRLKLSAPIKAELVKSNSPAHYLFDLKKETAGYLTFNINSSVKQNVLIAFGEHIVDGGVRRIIGARDFSVEFTLKAGDNNFTNYFRRFGCRYLELFCNEPVKVDCLTLIPCDYPLKINPYNFKNDLRNKIYSVCLDTLRLCMHEHYEDCPWREQALYTMDSRNQMLCGYYTFSEYQFARANLLLISKDDRPDGLLSICTPTNRNLVIPSFSLHYFTQVYEYTIYSKDLTLVNEIYPKLLSIINAFINKMQNGLVPNFIGKQYWNFYEWTDGLAGDKSEGNSCTLNALFSIALQNMQKISDLLGVKADYITLAKKVNAKLNEIFYKKELGYYINGDNCNTKSQLTSALCILCGAAPDAKALANLIASNTELSSVTLSMLPFKYDALLMVDSQKYKKYILDDIDSKYEKMLKLGATSFWETEEGESAFDNAGSLCHGWSAIPVYYYSILKD